jgi:hypothetical protein
MRALLAKLHELYLPNKVVMGFDAKDLAEAKLPTLLTGRTLVDGKVTAYVCHNFTCSLPVTEWGALKALLLTGE